MWGKVKVEREVRDGVEDVSIKNLPLQGKQLTYAFAEKAHQTTTPEPDHL